MRKGLTAIGIVSLVAIGWGIREALAVWGDLEGRM